jgi:hypothetical protein
MKVLAFIAVAMSFNVYAKTDSESLKCEFDESQLSKPVLPLEDLHKSARMAGLDICKNFLRILPEEQEIFEQRLTAFTSKVEETLRMMYPSDLFPGFAERATLWSQGVTNNTEDYRYLQFLSDGNILKGEDNVPNWEVWNNMNAYLPRLSYEVTAERVKFCQNALPNSVSCSDTFQQVKDAAKPFHLLISNYVLQKNGEKLTALQSDWKDFIDNARYQTPLDVWFTTIINREDFHGMDLVGPPSTQYFLLRPSLVYERIDSAPAGARDDIKLAVEWIGFNWWKKGFGMSVTSTYRDSAEVDAVGIGLTFHISNQYSIGFTHRGDNDNSVFFNIDLLEWFGDKKSVYEKYKKHL